MEFLNNIGDLILHHGLEIFALLVLIYYRRDYGLILLGINVIWGSVPIATGILCFIALCGTDTNHLRGFKYIKEYFSDKREDKIYNKEEKKRMKDQMNDPDFQ